MTTIDIENFLENVRGEMWNLTLADLEHLAVEVKQYGLDLKITNDLIAAFNNDSLKEYIESIT